MLLNSKHGIDKLSQPLGAMLDFILADPFRGGGHALDHIAVRVGEAGIVFEKVAMCQHVRDDQFVLNERIAVQQKGIARIRIDDELVNFAEPKVILHLHSD